MKKYFPLTIIFILLFACNEKNEFESNLKIENVSSIKIDSIIDSTIKENHPGLGVGIIKNGVVVYEYYRGLSNLQHQIPFSVRQLHALDECKKIDNKNYENTLKLLNERELNEVIEYQNSKGNEFQNSIQQILFQIANHFSHN